jgi:hypothetical protein
MGDLQQCYEAAERGMFADEDPAQCGCHGRGWFNSEVDTWHQCPVHYCGQRHPEDDRDDDEPCAEMPEMEPVPAMLDTDGFCDDNDIEF